MEQTATRIDWIGRSCRLLKAIGAEFERTRPFEGLSIGTGIHLEPKTVALLMTLRTGGARLVCTGNLNSTQPATVEFLRAQGITVFATQTTDPAAHHQSLEAVIAENRICCSTMAAISSPSRRINPMPISSAAPRRRPRAERACCRCASG